MFWTICLLFFGVCSCWAQTPDVETCPPTMPVDVPEARCGPTAPCEANKVCCPTESGGSMCVDPMTRRHFVTQEKPGRCPEYPRGPWICSNMCTGDVDCPRRLKCCGNRCGAFTCQMPESENAAPPPNIYENYVE